MKGQIFEKKAAKYMKGRHLGASGEPDYVRKGILGEVKDWGKRMGKSDIMTEIEKGRNEVVSKKGFTSEAVEYKNRYQSKVKLFDWESKQYQ